MKYAIFEERRSCRPTIQLSLGVSGKTLPNMTNMLKVLMVATNLVIFSQCLTGLKVCNTNLWAFSIASGNGMTFEVPVHDSDNEL